MKKCFYLIGLILLVSCGDVAEEDTSERQSIGGTIPLETNLVGDSYTIAENICLAFSNKRADFNAGFNSTNLYKIYEQDCTEDEYDFTGDVTAKVSRVSTDQYKFVITSGSSLITNVETDKSGMMEILCDEIEYNNSVAENLQKTISVIRDEGLYRYYHSFTQSGPNYILTRGKYVLDGENYINEAIDNLIIYGLDTVKEGLIIEKEAIEQCNDGVLRKFKQRIQ